MSGQLKRIQDMIIQILAVFPILMYFDLIFHAAFLSIL